MKMDYPIEVMHTRKNHEKNSNHPKLTNKKNSNQKIMTKSGIKIKWNKTKRDEIWKIK